MNPDLTNPMLDSSVGPVPVMSEGLTRLAEPWRKREARKPDPGRKLVIAVSPPGEAGARCHGFDALLADMLARLVNCDGSELQRELEGAFRRTCEFLEVERAGFWRRASRESGCFNLAFYYPSSRKQPGLSPSEAAAGLGGNGAHPSACGLLFGVGADSKTCFPWLSEQLERGQVIGFSSLAQLPPNAEVDKQTLVRLHIESAAVVPILVEGAVQGALGVALSAGSPWPEGLVEMLKLAGQGLAAGIARVIHSRELKHALVDALKFEMAIEAHAIVAVTDAQGRITRANDAFCKLSGYAREELLGQDHCIFDSGAQSREFLQELWAALKQGRVWRGETRRQDKDGSASWLMSTIVPVRNEAGRLYELVTLHTDISERKVAEEALLKSHAEIKQLKERLQVENECLKAEIKLNQAHGEIVGRSEAIRRVLRQVEQVAPVDCAVLITGETGTGKELMARAIHRLSPRKARTMVLVNCAALPATLVESELFGRERGAFTGALTAQAGRFEVADGSTIFLDEIGDLPLEMQAKLLRVLQEGEFQRLGSPKTYRVNVRIIAATNRDLAKQVREGRFREDLYYRLRVFPIEVPPLRERVSDIPLLVSAFLDEFSRRMSKPVNQVPRKALEVLERHPWPGNVRELRNVIERGIILSPGDTLVLPSLGEPAETTSNSTSLTDVEREHIRKTLEKTGWRVKGPYGAAKVLQVNPSTLYSRMEKLGIRRATPGDGVSTQG